MPTMFHCMQSFVRSTLHSHALTIDEKLQGQDSTVTCHSIHSLVLRSGSKMFQVVRYIETQLRLVAFAIKLCPILPRVILISSCGIVRHDTHTHTPTHTHTKASFHSYDSAMKLRTSPHRSRSCDDMFSVSVHGANSAFGDR